MADLGQEEVKEDQGQNSKDLSVETGPPPESMITEQVDVKKEEDVQEMLIGSLAVTQDVLQMDPTQGHREQTTQPERDGSVETEVACVTAVANEKVDVKKEENVQEMLVENPAVTQNAVQMDPTQEQVEQTTQPERDGSVEPEVVCVTAEENEQMEINQGSIENVVDELTVAVNDSTNLSKQEGNVECIDTASELMETDQLTVKEDGVTQEVTQVTPAQSVGETLKGDVTEGEENDKAEQSDTSTNRASIGSSDATIPQVPVAMEIDTQGENSDASSLTKVELTESKLESATAQNSESDQPVKSGEAETSAVMNIEPVAEYDGSETLVQLDNSSEQDGLSTKPASNT